MGVDILTTAIGLGNCLIARSVGGAKNSIIARIIVGWRSIARGWPYIYQTILIALTRGDSNIVLVIRRGRTE